MTRAEILAALKDIATGEHPVSRQRNFFGGMSEDFSCHCWRDEANDLPMNICCVRVQELIKKIEEGVA